MTTPLRQRMPRFLAVVTLLAGFLTAVTATPAQAAVTVYPVPTSAAKLGRIVTAPDGSMWFTERDANKVGRITTSGQITEVDLPPTTAGEGMVMDLDIAADGTIWVVYDSGRHAIALNPDGSRKTGPIALYGRPYGEEIRVAPDGTPWLTMSFDEDFIAWIKNDQAHSSDNSPPCDGALAIGHDGTRWCQDWDAIIKVNPGGDGGVTYPLPPNASYPHSLSPGPVGSIWYARRSSGTWITDPSRGSIGYLDAATGTVTDINTGSKTAPASLVQGAGGRMWFTSVGSEPAIGHYDVATGRGAITKVGNYSPNWLTVGADGAIWATDATNNVILRVTTGELTTTNIDLGTGSVLKPHPTPAPPSPRKKHLGRLQVGKKPLVVRKRTVRLPIACPARSAGCRGTARIKVGKRVVTKAASYRVAAGRKKVVRLTVTRKGMRTIKRKPTRAVAELLKPGARKPSVRRKIRLRR